MLATDIEMPDGERLSYDVAVERIARHGGTGFSRWWHAPFVLDQKRALLAFGYDGAAKLGMLPEYKRLVLGIE